MRRARFPLGLLLAGVCAASGAAALRLPPGWACTELPHSLWLPLHVLTERLRAKGLEVLDATMSHNACYTVRLRQSGGRIEELRFDPVSARPVP